MVYIETLGQAAFRIVSAGVFLLFAGGAIELALVFVERAASRRFPEETISKLVKNSVRAVLWFSAVLIALSILGLGGIAASFGTAAGFVALGVSFALKDVLSDTVAGVYLAKDPDFNHGDSVEVDGVEGVVKDVGLRKSRIELENGDLRVVNNSDVEKKWTLLKE